MLKKFFVAVFLFVAVILGIFITKAEVATPAQNVDGDLKISMLNIGYGDAILIQTGEQTILIDTARTDERDLLIKELEKCSVTKIDKIILTHPHADHIGGVNLLLNPSQKDFVTYPYVKKISVDKVYDNGVAYTSKRYRNYMQTIKEKNIPHQSLKRGDTLDFGNGVNFKVIWPTEEFVATVNSKPLDKDDKEHSINNGSIVGKLTYKNFSMMFTGDCTRDSEAKILANTEAEYLKCDILKSGHHGRGSSSTKEFVAAINPSVVLISASEKKGSEIIIGSPHARVLQNYLTCTGKENIFCTRFNGTITVTSDGENFSAVPEKEEDWIEKWIAYQQEHKKK